MGRKKGTKVKNDKKLVEEKKIILQKHWDIIHSQCEEFEIRVNKLCDEECAKISKLYDDKLKKLPEHIRNMTLTEYLEVQRKAEAVEMQQQPGEANCASLIRSQYEKSKLESEKKKTLKKRKRSCSVSSVFSANRAFPPTLSSASRTLSESCLGTPLMKRSAAPSCVVTPKFNPRAPINKICMRRPRVGEVVMSLSGSPLHNVIDDIAHKPGVSLSLGGGNIINITEDTELSKLESDFLKKLDEETMSTLVNVKQKLDMILKS